MKISKKIKYFIKETLKKNRMKKIELFNRSYSQDGEDMVLASFYELMPDYKGFYIDIGAHHPTRFSNTKYFYDKGWRGINIDATPGSMNAFLKFRSEDINLEIGISPTPGEKKYFIFDESALNTFDEKIAKTYQNRLKGTKTIQTFLLNDILDKYVPIDKEIDFLSIDVEGFDLDIMKTLNLNKYKPKYIFMEDLGLRDDDLVQLGISQSCLYLKQHKYLPIAKTRRTILFKKKES